MLKKTRVFPLMLAALCAWCLAAVCLLTACGSDMLATTQEAKDGGQASASASATAIADSQAAQTPGPHQVLVQIDCSNAHAYNAKFPESLGSFMVDIEPGASVLDVLDATKVDYSMRGRNYVLSIGGIEEKVCGRDSGWVYLVDGEQPTKTANDYILNGGETVRWAYTVTEGDVKEG